MLKEISNQELEQAAQKIANDPVYGKNETLLGEMFKRFPDNKDAIVVSMKTGLIDTLYSTHLNIHQKTTPIHNIIDAILKSEFDKKIKNGDTSIAGDLLSKLNNNLFSFISKYCTLHSYFVYGKDDFAIYDNIVSEHIYEYTDKLKGKHSAKNKYMIPQDYKGWVSLINEILQENHITTRHAKRKLDWFIWYSNK